MIRHVFITGASSGIGRACVERAIAKGWCVSACARRKDALDRLQQRFGDHICCTQADVGDQEQLHQAVAAGVERFGELHALIANAGRGLDGELCELSDDDISAVFDTNLVGIHRSVLACLDFFAQQASIVVVASVASFLPIPRMAAYCATKAAVEQYSAGLRMELRERGIAVMSCCPGTVSTEFFEAAPKPGAVWDWRPGTSLTSVQVARAIMHQAARRRPRRRVLPWFAAVTAFLYRCLPSFGEWVMRRVLQRMRQRERSQAISSHPDRPAS